MPTAYPPGSISYICRRGSIHRHAVSCLCGKARYSTSYIRCTLSNLLESGDAHEPVLSHNRSNAHLGRHVSALLDGDAELRRGSRVGGRRTWLPSRTSSTCRYQRKWSVAGAGQPDRKSTRLNPSHAAISRADCRLT